MAKSWGKLGKVDNSGEKWKKKLQKVVKCGEKWRKVGKSGDKWNKWVKVGKSGENWRKVGKSGHFGFRFAPKSIGFFHSRSSMAVSIMNLICALVLQLRETQALFFQNGCQRPFWIPIFAKIDKDLPL